MTRQHDRPGLTRPTADEDGELTRLRTEKAQLMRALASRPVIDQARGVIMTIGHCTPQEAWEVLVAVSQRTNTKLHTVAGHVVATTTGRRLSPALHRELYQLLRTRSAKSPGRAGPGPVRRIIARSR